MKKKILMTAALISVMSLSSISSVYAGDWKSDAKGWWWQEDNGTYPVSIWKEINGKYYYFGSDGYMLANTTTPDGYKVGADGAWIQEGNNSQFKFKDRVTQIMNASSYEEAIAGLQNVQQRFSMGGDFTSEYKITADNLPFEITWMFESEGYHTDYGIYITGEPVPKEFMGVNGVMNEIFDGLDKESYTIAEFETLVKSAGATDIIAVDRSYVDYIPGFNGNAGKNYNVKECLIYFTLGKYRFHLDAGGNATNKNALVINETRVNMWLNE